MWLTWLNFGYQTGITRAIAVAPVRTILNRRVGLGSVGSIVRRSGLSSIRRLAGSLGTEILSWPSLDLHARRSAARSMWNIYPQCGLFRWYKRRKYNTKKRRIASQNVTAIIPRYHELYLPLLCALSKFLSICLSLSLSLSPHWYAHYSEIFLFLSISLSPFLHTHCCRIRELDYLLRKDSI